VAGAGGLAAGESPHVRGTTPCAVRATQRLVQLLAGVGNLLGVPTGAFLIGEGETLLAFKYNSVIGQLLVFVAIVIAIRVFPRGIFGYHERR